MARFIRKTRVSAPLDTVWAFHSTIEGLKALTPSWVGLQIEALRVPDGGEELVAGSEIDLSFEPIPSGPRQGFTSIIVDREKGTEAGSFVDEMQDGPLAKWRHTHRFVAESDETVIIDDIEYETGYGKILDRAVKLGFGVAFALRHRKTREILGRAEA